MPNGRHGDHPLTDIVAYSASIFGESIDDRIRILASHPSFNRVRERLANVLLDNSPHWASGKCNLEEVSRELEACEHELADID